MLSIALTLLGLEALFFAIVAIASRVGHVESVTLWGVDKDTDAE